MNHDVDDAAAIVSTGFSAYLPLPYRVPLIVALGVFLFGTNLTLLLRSGIDIESLFYPSSTPTTALSRQQESLTRPVYAIAVALLGISSIGTLVFWTITAGSTSSTFDARWIPVVLFLAFLTVLVVPGRLYAQERYRFLGVLRRILLGGIDATDRFLDVVVADIMTSYAKVFGDTVTTVCLFFSAADASYVDAKDGCSRNILVPLAIAAPYAMRLRQCLTEYRRTGSRAHLANALKYCTAFPVILISTSQLYRSGGEAGTPNTAYISDHRLYQLWIVACMVNSGYSFWWDVTKDWDLTLLSPSPASHTRHHGTTLQLRVGERVPYGLRANLTFPSTSYYAAVVVDLVLRMLWSIKLSPHLHNLTEYESGVFGMECLEVVRRWMWIFLRVECEHQRANAREGGIALTEFGGVAFTTSGPLGKLDQD